MFIYHPYAVNPDANYRGGEHDETDWPTKPRPLLALVRGFSPRYGIMQGEAGCPANWSLPPPLARRPSGVHRVDDFQPGEPFPQKTAVAGDEGVVIVRYALSGDPPTVISFR